MYLPRELALIIPEPASCQIVAQVKCLGLCGEIAAECREDGSQVNSVPGLPLVCLSPQEGGTVLQ